MMNDFFSQVYGTKHDRIFRRYPSVWIDFHRNVSTPNDVNRQALVTEVNFRRSFGNDWGLDYRVL